MDKWERSRRPLLSTHLSPSRQTYWGQESRSGHLISLDQWQKGLNDVLEVRITGLDFAIKFAFLPPSNSPSRPHFCSLPALPRQLHLATSLESPLYPASFFSISSLLRLSLSSSCTWSYLCTLCHPSPVILSLLLSTPPRYELAQVCKGIRLSEGERRGQLQGVPGRIPYQRCRVRPGAAAAKGEREREER